MLEIMRTKRTYGREVFLVKGDIDNFTDEQIANRCVCGNFGYKVAYYGKNEMLIEVYTD